jgi:hypothetical protein
MRAMSLLLFVPLALAGDADEAHPHTGVVPAFSGAPPELTLTAAEEGTLKSGVAVRKQVRYDDDSGGRGVAVMDVAAPTDIIWSKIGNYSAYPSWIDNLSTCEIYEKDGQDVYVYFKASVVGFPVEWWIKHDFQTAKGYVTWTLDYRRHSDLHDSVGYWRVTELSTDPPLSRIEYSVDLRVSGWVPGAIEDMLANKGLVEATEWVKKQSEKDAQAK